MTDDPRRWKIHRNRRGWPSWYQPWLEAWWIITGKWSLHRAWQDGVLHGVRREYARLITDKAAISEMAQAHPPLPLTRRSPNRGEKL